MTAIYEITTTTGTTLTVTDNASGRRASVRIMLAAGEGPSSRMRFWRSTTGRTGPESKHELVVSDEEAWHLMQGIAKVLGITL